MPTALSASTPAAEKAMFPKRARMPITKRIRERVASSSCDRAASKCGSCMARHTAAPFCCPPARLVLLRRRAGADAFRHQGLDLLHPADWRCRTSRSIPPRARSTVVATDLVLPGNAGFTLAIQRVYNSSVYPDYADGGSTAYEEDSWPASDGSCTSAASCTAIRRPPDRCRSRWGMAAGTRSITGRPTRTSGRRATSGSTTPRRTSCSCRTVAYTFDREVVLNERLGTVRYVTEIRDPYQNRITVDYFDASGPPDGIPPSISTSVAARFGTSPSPTTRPSKHWHR